MSTCNSDRPAQQRRMEETSGKSHHPVNWEFLVSLASQALLFYRYEMVLNLLDNTPLGLQVPYFKFLSYNNSWMRLILLCALYLKGKKKWKVTFMEYLLFPKEGKSAFQKDNL